MKKFIALLLCLCALLGAVSGSASAAKKEITKEDALKKSASQSYYRSLYAAGKESFHGYCGLMTSCQMHSLGINKWRISNDGNDQFDYYSALEVTSGGYYITPYYLEEYSLEQALMHVSRNGTRDVYNILVGFQWTNTEAGSKYGHAVFINGILDGRVYFVESFDSSVNRYYPEGSVITCSIPEFVEFYADWTTYEGLVWFGNGEYADACQVTGTDLMIQTRFDTTLRSQPFVAGQNGCEVLRPVSAGERLRATAILDDPMGDRYYRVTDGEVTGYIAAGAAFVTRVNPEDLEVLDLQISRHIPAGQGLQIAGQVFAKNGSVGAVEVEITDSAGHQVAFARCDAAGFNQQLDELNEKMPVLPAGEYLVQVYGVCAQIMPAGQELRPVEKRILLAKQNLQVGGEEPAGEARPAMMRSVEQTREGWFFENGSWYCYENGQPKCGWVEDAGVGYYLDDTGAALTGWQSVDGSLYKFSGSGAKLYSMEAEYDGAVYVLDDTGVATVKGKE